MYQELTMLAWIIWSMLQQPPVATAAIVCSATLLWEYRDARRLRQAIRNH